MINLHHRWNISLKPQFVGFALSMMLTICAYWVARRPIFSPQACMWIVVMLGVLQALIQLVFFLQLGIESKPRWNLLIFLFMLLLIFILIVGSLWIMSNLNYHMSPTMRHD